MKNGNFTTSRLFIARSLLNLATIECIRGHSDDQCFEILIIAMEGKYPELNQTFSDPTIRSYLSSSFDLIINLNDLIFPSHPCSLKLDSDIQIWRNLSKQFLAKREVLEIVAPNLTRAYCKLLCDVFSKATVSLYFDGTNNISAYTNDDVARRVSRVKNIYDFDMLKSIFSKFIPSKDLITTTIHKTNFMKGLEKVTGTGKFDLKKTDCILVNATTDGLENLPFREWSMSEYKRMLTLTKAIDRTTRLIFRPPQNFDELDRLVLEEWYLNEYDEKLICQSSEKEFLLLFQSHNIALAVGYPSSELVIVKELTNAPVIAIKLVGQTGLEKDSTGMSTITDMIFNNYFFPESELVENITFSELNNLIDNHYSRIRTDSNDNLFKKISVLLFFSKPDTYFELRKEIENYLGKCTPDEFSQLIGKPYLDQQRIQKTITAWPKANSIKNKFNQIFVEYKQGNLIVAELACQLYLETSFSTDRSALLAKILFDTKRKKHAVKSLFCRDDTNYSKEHISPKISTMWKMLHFLLFK